MKSFLTFTLAAGVAITTTSIAQAQSTTHKGNASVSKEGISKQLPRPATAPSLVLDRAAMNRELSALRLEFETFENDDNIDAATAPRRKSVVGWIGG